MAFRMMAIKPISIVYSLVLPRLGASIPIGIKTKSTNSAHKSETRTISALHKNGNN
jgi:hypothetical protein